MQIFSLADYHVMPWKNGGGTTTELFKAPTDLPGMDFLWRVSIADVASDGPFSLFPGYDRHIMCIEGDGMVLHGGPTGSVDLTQQDRPRTFSGDWHVTSKLVAGPIHDFNLIAARQHVSSSLFSMRPTSPFELGGESSITIFAHIISGELQVGGKRLLSGHSLLLQPQESLLVSVLLPQPPRLAVCKVALRN